MKVFDVWNPDGKLEIVTMLMFEKKVSTFVPKLPPHTSLWQLDDTHYSNVAPETLFARFSLIVFPLDLEKSSFFA